MTRDQARIGTRVTSHVRLNPNDRGTIVDPPFGHEPAFPPHRYAFVRWDSDYLTCAYLLEELDLATAGDQP